MENENFKIEFDGVEDLELYNDLLGLEVEIDESFASMARLKLPLKQLDEGWSYLDDERFRPWKKVSVKAGFDSEIMLFSGYITHVRPLFEPDVTQCRIEVWAMDERIRLDRAEKLKAWENKKDSDIAKAILAESGFTGPKGKVEKTTIVHDVKVSTIIQRETDLQFLNRLAMRNGFEFYVDGETAFFREPVLDGEAQPVLALQFGMETNLGYFEIEVNALTAAETHMSGVDRMGKKLIKSEAAKSTKKALGKSGPETFTAAGVPESKAFIGMNPVSGQPEMEALCKSVFQRGQWFVTAKGKIEANRYGHVLKTRETVTIKGIGDTYSGDWYVTHVTHSFTPGKGYIQQFKVKRNGLMLLGSEDFTSDEEAAALSVDGIKSILFDDNTAPFKSIVAGGKG
ncbi:MAG: phage late control D family protein [bacterium]|nr:phage late control D family protein [bacterium]